MKSLVYSNTNKEKVNFLSRIFGVFSEEIVKIWCDNRKNKDFEYIGKPHINVGKKRPIKLDHLLKSNNTYFIVEKKKFMDTKVENYHHWMIPQNSLNVLKLGPKENQRIKAVKLGTYFLISQINQRK